MSLIQTLKRYPDGWNHPRWPRVFAPVAAAAGAVIGSLAAGASGYDSALAAGIGAGLAVIVAWIVLAALD